MLLMLLLLIHAFQFTRILLRFIPNISEVETMSLLDDPAGRIGALTRRTSHAALHACLS
jgi:hypothetical protein